LIHSIKYDANKELAFSLGRSYAHELLEVIKRQQIDLIVPVPLHPNKEKERGYNQSFEIARGVSTVVDVPVIKGFLVRKNHTASLTHMTKSKRIKTLAHAYRLSKKEVSLNVPKHILLVDDVMTTGSTVIACFEALSLIPNCKISVLVIAVGQ
jgi:ComF family protein